MSEEKLICNTHDRNTLGEYRYVVVLSHYQGQILLSRHKDRTTWETQGGHIEPGETLMEAAKRELYEESGAREFEIRYLCDYRAEYPSSHNGANGAVFAAEIHMLDLMPESEMAEVRTFQELPAELSYPEITPVLFRYLDAELAAAENEVR